jgi:hypothetical protein
MKPDPSDVLLKGAASPGTHPASAPPRHGRLLRLALIVAVGLFYLAAVLDAADPAVAVVGFAPLVWLAAEAIWRLFDR